MQNALTFFPPIHRACETLAKAGAIGLLATACLSACFYDEVINEEPQPGIRLVSTGLHYIGDLLQFDATKTIDDDDELTAEWTAFACVAPGDCRKLSDVSYKSIATKFDVEVLTHETIEVQLRVVDRFGAVRLQPDLLTSVISNRIPSIDIQQQGTREEDDAYVLGLPIHFVALSVSDNSTGGQELLPVLRDMDGDPTTISWELLPPSGSNVADRVFEAEGDTGYKLVPDIPGEWTIVLSADDGYGGTAEIRTTLIVAQDGPPCLTVMSPQPVDDGFYPVDSLDEPRRFSVLSVVDALDSFPRESGADLVFGEASFQWLLRAPGATEFVAIPGVVAASYVVDPAAYQPGDKLELRVEISDRVSGPERMLPCGNDVWSCALNTGSKCFQRKSWGVEIR